MKRASQAQACWQWSRARRSTGTGSAASAATFDATRVVLKITGLPAFPAHPSCHGRAETRPARRDRILLRQEIQVDALAPMTWHESTFTIE